MTEKYYARKSIGDQEQIIEWNKSNDSGQSSKKHQVKVNLNYLPLDLGLRIKIANYDPNDRDEI